jgi:hypothetical protein
MTMIYKKCNVCSETKLLCEFGKDSHMADGHMYRCRVCNRKKTAKWQQDNRERSNAYHREYHAADPDRLERRKAKIRQCKKAKYDADIAASRAYQNAYLKNNPEKARQFSRNNRKKNYAKILALNANRRASKLSATPKWLNAVQKEQIKWFYAAARMMSQTSGVPHHVDHIHPLVGEGFNGLHVPWNLQVLPGSKNISKHNKPPETERQLFWEAA